MLGTPGAVARGCPRSARVRRSHVVLVALGLSAAAAGAGWWLFGRHAEEGPVRTRGLRDYECGEPGKVYFGRLPIIRRPASVVSAEAYAQIPEYARIRNEGIGADTPQYTLLMKTVSDRFLAAVAEVARTHDHDVIAERGAIQRGGPDVPEVPDRTADVVAALARR